MRAAAAFFLATAALGQTFALLDAYRDVWWLSFVAVAQLVAIGLIVTDD